MVSFVCKALVSPTLEQRATVPVFQGANVGVREGSEKILFLIKATALAFQGGL